MSGRDFFFSNYFLDRETVTENPDQTLFFHWSENLNHELGNIYCVWFAQVVMFFMLEIHKLCEVTAEETLSTSSRGLCSAFGLLSI